MKNKLVQYLIILVLIFAVYSCKTPTSIKKPNILILFADDLGYADIGCYGSPALTPNLDSLASSGIQFTDYYAGAPNCSPSRVSLLTGRIPALTGMYNYRKPGSVMHMTSEEITIAEILKKQGYQTAHFGKWHLGCLPQDTSLNQPQPHDQGFDYSLGTETNAYPSHLNPDNFIRNGKPAGQIKGYSCQILAREINKWFTEDYNANEPFFIFTAFHEPHGPIASPPELTAKYQKYSNQYLRLPEGTSLAEYYANIENIDIATGKILSTLEKNNALENTLIFFASDNGPVRNGSQGELRGLKGEVYDGGIKVPAILHYPVLTENYGEITTPVWAADILPTICNLIEITQPQNIDGVSILPLFEGKDLKRSRPLFWFFYRSSPEVSMRKENFVLTGRSDDSTLRAHWITDIDMPFINTFNPDHYELFNLSDDPGQRNDLSSVYPEKTEELKRIMLEMLQDVIENGRDWERLIQYNPQGPKHNKVEEFKRNKRIYLNEK